MRSARIIWAGAASLGLLLSAGAGAVEPIELIPVDGEGAKYWTPLARTVGTGRGRRDELRRYVVRHDQREVEGRDSRARPLLADRLEGSPVPHDRKRRRRRRCRCSRSTARLGSCCGKRRCRRRASSTSTGRTATRRRRRQPTASASTRRSARTASPRSTSSGKLLWHQKPGDLANYHGSAGSPVLYKDRVFLYQDHSGTDATGSFVGGLRRAHRRRRCGRRSAPRSVGWGTPVVIDAGDRDELIVNSQQQGLRLRSRHRRGALDGARARRAKSSRRRSSAMAWCSARRAAPVRRSRSGRAARAT